MLHGTAAQFEATPARSLTRIGLKILIVDLNNFATFPTLAIGLLVAALRHAGNEVQVLCPLAYDVPAVARERRETLRDHLARRLHLSTWGPVRRPRDLARAAREWWINRPHPVVLREVERALRRGPDIVLLSAYLQHYPTVVRIGELAELHGVPALLGGPMFNVHGVAEAWRAIPGIRAVVGGEFDLAAPDLVRATCAGEDLLRFDGVCLPDGRRSPPAPPLRPLDRTPVPDFTDFPWDLYPFRIVPLMTGRGCQWNRCVFCSDVVSASGRTFRTRGVESVMLEMQEQARRHRTSNFLFLDLKLNSNPNMMRGISENVQHFVPGAEWIGTVHVDLRKDNGLSPGELKAAVRAGMRRISFGLETGSQRLLDAMDKGSSVEANSAFIRHAYEAGLSIRCTMFKGFPGETADDLKQTADFLEQHARYLDRVRFNEFAILEDTPIYRALRGAPDAYPEMVLSSFSPRYGRARGEHAEAGIPAYRRAKARVLRLVYEINRRDVRQTARAFDGLM
jgi:radical SAM superfamily enzyme YgiQ (UPF0313 family)